LPIGIHSFLFFFEYWKYRNPPSGAIRAFAGNAEGLADNLDGRWVLRNGLVLCAATTATQANLPSQSGDNPYVAAMSNSSMAGDLELVYIIP